MTQLSTPPQNVLNQITTRELADVHSSSTEPLAKKIPAIAALLRTGRRGQTGDGSQMLVVCLDQGVHRRARALGLRPRSQTGLTRVGDKQMHCRTARRFGPNRRNRTSAPRKMPRKKPHQTGFIQPADPNARPPHPPSEVFGRLEVLMDRVAGMPARFQMQGERPENYAEMITGHPANGPIPTE